ncbi:MFS transporter permease [Microbacterium mangrovi]|uniref:MFS transporter permease n=1 Tax=Microbacterium mangrovi TaxID=1348253 RepID=A0A0B2A360_9MICO|nr:MFS transporter [Microbacterium mangrovi]KHK96013.1 MFS transporter permease [Microbacterium mangrovi]
MNVTVTHSQLVRWRTAIFAIFLLSGLGVASWAARVPAIKDALDINREGLGLLLLLGGIASILGISTSSVIMARFGTRRGMLGTLTVFCAGLALIGIGTDIVHQPWLVGLGLAFWGFGGGSTDVMMNVEATAIEQQMGRTILPLFHAFFSFGTVIGAGLGIVAITLGLTPFDHLLIVAIGVLVLCFVAIANIPVTEGEEVEPDAPKAPFRERLHVALSAWREPRTYAIGVIMLGMAFAEGSANDWLALGIVEGHGVDNAALGAAGLTVFSVSMTVVRVFGGPLVDRFGRVFVLRVLSATAVAGLLLFILGPTVPLLFVGAALWGIGASLGFPLGMSAAADDPAKAAGRVAAAATMGYVAFLAGPPLLGYVSEHIGLLNTLYIIVALIVASGFASGAAKPLAPTYDTAKDA